MGEYGQMVGQSSGGGGLPGGGGGLPGGGGSHDLGGQFMTALSDTANQVAGLPLWAQVVLLVAAIVVGFWILRQAF